MKRSTQASAFVATALSLTAAASAHAGSWLLGFSPADTLPAGAFAAIAGTGGQVSVVGDPSRTSFTPFLAHAGIRYGVADGWDVGYRLATVALPFSSVGPSLGGEIDVKHRLTAKSSPWQVAVVAGLGYSYLEIAGQSRSAWSPGADLVISHAVSGRTTVFSDIRYVYTAIPTAAGGEAANHFQALGPGLGLKTQLSRAVSLSPEVGVFDFTGRLTGARADGVGFQYGAVLGFRF